MIAPRTALRQRVRNVRIAGLRPQLSATGCDNDVLLPTHCEGARRCVAGRRQPRLPEQLTSRLVEGAKPGVLSGGDEYQPACSDDRSAVLLGSRYGNALR